MDIESISTEPQVSDFQDLATYQSTTPTSFFTGPPVLHHHSPSCSLAISSTYLWPHAQLFHQSLTDLFIPPNPSSQVNEITVSAFILSTSLTLWSPSANKGVHIPYRAISLHARQGAGIYLQLCLDDVRRVADEELRSMDATLTPAGEGEAEKVFEALSECAELWPDPVEEDGEEGLEGGGWITAENAGEFVEAEGEDHEMNGVNGDGGLGPGAGSRRAAEDGDDDEAKWRRTD